MKQLLNWLQERPETKGANRLAYALSVAKLSVSVKMTQQTAYIAEDEFTENSFASEKDAEEWLGCSLEKYLLANENASRVGFANGKVTLGRYNGPFNKGDEDISPNQVWRKGQTWFEVPKAPNSYGLHSIPRETRELIESYVKTL